MNVCFVAIDAENHSQIFQYKTQMNEDNSKYLEVELHIEPNSKFQVFQYFEIFRNKSHIDFGLHSRTF